MTADRVYPIKGTDRRAYYATAPLSPLQHLVPGLFPKQTFCGRPVYDWSNQELRTVIGITCPWCGWAATRKGRPVNSLGAWVWIAVAGVMVACSWIASKFRRTPPPPSPSLERNTQQ